MFFTPTKTSTKPPFIFWPLMVLVIILAADVATVLILHLFSMSFSEICYLAAPAAALIVGVPAWVRFVVIANRVTIRRGVAIGIVGSIIAHPIMWILVDIADRSMFPNTNDLSMSYLPLFIIYGLIYAGWITTPIGALAGMLLIYLQRFLTRSQRYTRRAGEAILRREMGGFTTDGSDTEKEGRS